MIFFKKFNDTYGHLQGDKCLHTVSQAIKAVATRPRDITCRYGGEEIVVLLPSTTSEHACSVAEDIRLAVQNLGIIHEGSELKEPGVITISLGVITVYPDRNTSVFDILKGADEAMYKAKKSGRNQVSVFEVKVNK